MDEQYAGPLRDWLGVAFAPHRSHAVCTICSIYFDTPEMQSLNDKMESDYVKTKYRIRWYADESGAPLPVPAYLEIKDKRGSTRFKHRAALPMPPRELTDTPLDAPLFERLFRAHCPPEARLTLPLAPLRPVLELRYTRHRYTHPLFDSAFCLDSDIRGTRAHPAVKPASPDLPLSHDVFEQKGGSDDPLPVLRPLPRFEARRGSFSKYHLIALQHASSSHSAAP